MGPPNAEAAKVITLKKQGFIAIITINIPHKLNAMNQAHYFRIATLLLEIAEMPDIAVTVVTAQGRFFSAGADVTSGGTPDPDVSTRQFWNQSFVANNLHNARAWYTHPKILVVALNGPAVGMSAAMVAHADFIYAAPHTWLLTPFSSLGLMAEGVASVAFVRRMGLTKANEALLMSRKIGCQELVGCGFVNAVFAEGGGDPETGTGGFSSERFLERVLTEVRDRLGEHLNRDSLVGVKKLIRGPMMQDLERANVEEVHAGLGMFVKGAPQKEFAAISSGKKRHKL